MVASVDQVGLGGLQPVPYALLRRGLTKASTVTSRQGAVRYSVCLGA